MGKWQPQSTANQIANAWKSLREDPLVTLREVQQTLGSVSLDTVRRWQRERRFRSVKVGGRLMVRRSAVLAFIRDAQDDGGMNAKVGT